MNPRIITDSEIRIINADNPGQYHVWPVSEGLEPARKVAEAWEDDELLAEIDNAADPLKLKKLQRAAVGGADAVWRSVEAAPTVPVIVPGASITITPPIVKPKRGRKPKGSQ